MAVREALLTLLSVEPTYGFRMHNELIRRLPHRASLNVGQSYTTIERARKAGLLENAGFTDDALPLFALTVRGTSVVQNWLNGDDGAGSPHDETKDRVLLTLSLGSLLPSTIGTAVDVLEREQQRWTSRAHEQASSPDALNDLNLAFDNEHAVATLAWLKHIATQSLDSFELPFDTARPRRGRPRRNTVGSTGLEPVTKGL